MDSLRLLSEMLTSTELSIPLFQMILLLVGSTALLLFGKIKGALIVNYIFVFYWGYVFNKEHLVKCFEDRMSNMIYIYFYFGLGFVIFVLAMLAFLTPSD